jgi:myo-inositol-1(or 4)-monophosphatase
MKNDIDIDQLAFTAQQAAIAAGEILREGFYTEVKTTAKSSRHDVVTIFDTKSEECIFSRIHESFPEDVFLGEESGLSTNPQGKVVWIVDPLDGTMNFSRQTPIFTISIAAVYENQVLCGVVYQPMTGELFVAKKGQGAFLNQEKIHVSSTDEVSHGVYAIGFPYVAEGESPLNVDFCFKLLRQGTPIRNLGSGALSMAYLAAGRFDGFWIPSLYSWDMAAGYLLVEEAGGKVSHQDGRPFDHLVTIDAFDIIATNGSLHDKLLDALKIEH